MAATFIAYYGIRLNIDEAEVESLESRLHPALLRARQAGLEHYWGNFGSPAESYLLFIGKSLGKFGVEQAYGLQISLDQLSLIAAQVSKKLNTGGFAESPTLLIHFHPDS